MTFTSFQLAQDELQAMIECFDWVRAEKLLKEFDKLFGGRDQYKFTVEGVAAKRPKLIVTYEGMTLTFKCYKLC